MRGEHTRLGDSREALGGDPPTCSRAHLDGERDVCVGAEAPAPVAGAVVEAAACEDSRGVARARLKAQTPPPTFLPVPPPRSAPRDGSGLQDA